MIDASGHNYGDAPTMIAQHLESTDGSSDLNVTFRALSAYSDQGMGEAPSMTNKGITIDVTGTFRAGTNVIFFLPEVTGSGAKMPSHETSLMTESTSPIVNPVFAKESYQNCTKEDFEAQLEGACGEEEEPACTPGGSYPADPPPECKTTTELDALDKVYCNHTTSPAGKDLKTEWSGTTTAGGGVSGVASVEVSVTGTVSTVTRATAQPGECLTNFRCLSTCSVECEESYFYISFLAGIGWGTRTATCACAVQGASGPVTCQMQKG
jgi:hypothetical protein